MILGIDPKVDFAFKLMFGSPEHPRVTIHFLNAVLQLPEPLTSVEILNPIQGRDRADDKLVVLDILAADETGRQYNVEMQTTLPTDLRKRLTYYNCLNYVGQLAAGESYHLLRRAVSICVLDRTLFGDVTPHHLSFRLRCDQVPLVFSDDLEFHTLELPKFEPTNRQIETLPQLEKWLYLLKYAARMDPNELSALLVESEYHEALEVLTMISRTPEERQFYEARNKFLHDQEGRLVAAREEGIAIGIEKGVEKGMEKGMEKGVVAGRIQMLQELLGDEPSSLQELTSRPLGDLSLLVAELQTQVRNRYG